MYVIVGITTQEKDDKRYYVSLLKWHQHQKLLAKYFNGKTSHEVALIGLIDTLKTIHDKDKKILVDTDIDYIYQSIRYKWYNSWYENGWIKSNGDPVANQQLWRELREEILRFNNVTVSRKYPMRIEVLKKLVLEGEV